MPTAVVFASFVSAVPLALWLLLPHPVFGAVLVGEHCVFLCAFIMLEFLERNATCSRVVRRPVGCASCCRRPNALYCTTVWIGTQTGPETPDETAAEAYFMESTTRRGEVKASMSAQRHGHLQEGFDCYDTNVVS